MFLNQLSTPLQKALFLELAALVMMASHDDDASELMAEYNDYAVLSKFLANKFLASIDIKATKIMGYMIELSSNDHDNFDSYSCLDEGYLGEIIDVVLEKNRNNTKVQQEVIQYLIANGEDIFDLNPEKIQICMASLPKIKQEILQRTVQEAFKSKQTMGLTLSEREKKIILCELIDTAYSCGTFEAEAKQLLESICQTLHIDNEYIEEFDDVMTKLFKVNQELAELINE